MLLQPFHHCRCGWRLVCVCCAGVPFRETHHISGAAVKLAEDRDVTLFDLTVEDLKGIHPQFEDDVLAVPPCPLPPYCKATCFSADMTTNGLKKIDNTGLDCIAQASQQAEMSTWDMVLNPAMFPKASSSVMDNVMTQRRQMWCSDAGVGLRQVRRDAGHRGGSLQEERPGAGREAQEVSGGREPLAHQSFPATLQLIYDFSDLSR